MIFGVFHIIMVKKGMIPVKIMIASDIHGSEFYCKKLVEAYKREGADRLLLLGDILYHGPRNDLPEGYAPKKVIEILNGMRDELLCVRGNCDTEVDQMVLDFPILADYAVLSAGDKLIYATHGHKFGKDNPPPLKDGDILLCGHTHIPECTDCGKLTYLNTGSVSIPKENSWHGYILLENNEFIWRDFDGEIKMKFKI